MKTDYLTPYLTRLKTGYWPVRAGVDPLLDFDACKPVQQDFPSTAAALAGMLGDPTLLADHIWTCQETSGPLLDSAGSSDLAEGGTPLRGQKAIGLWDGTSYTSQGALEFKAVAGEKFVAADTTHLAYDASTSFAVLLVFRGMGLVAGSQALLGKRTGVPYWWLYMGAGGALIFTVHDGATAAGASLGSNHDEGAWHCVIAVANRNTDLLQIHTDIGNATPVSIAGKASFDSTSVFGLGGIPASAGQWCQQRYVAAFSGAAAEALDATALAAFWAHATDPTGELTTTTRASLISVPVAVGRVSHFSGVSVPPQLPIGLHPAMGGTCLGLYTNNAPVNHVPHSETIATDWSVLSCTNAARDADAPDGLLSATSATQTVINGLTYESMTGLATSTDYTASVWLRTDQSDHTATLAVTTAAAGAAILEEADVTVTSEWQRFELPFTTGVAQTGTRFCIYPGERLVDNDKQVHAWGAQIELEDEAGAYIRTSGAAAALISSDYQIAGNHVWLPTGELEVLFVTEKIPDTGLNYLFDNGASADRRACWIDTVGSLKFRVGNAAGGIVQTLTVGTLVTDTQYTLVVQWAEDASLPGAVSVRAKLSGAAAVGGGSSFTSGGGYLAALRIGTSGTQALDGYIQRLRAWNKPTRVLP